MIIIFIIVAIVAIVIIITSVFVCNSHPTLTEKSSLQHETNQLMNTYNLFLSLLTIVC